MTCDQKGPKSLQVSHSAAHWLLASEVKATVIPSPYRHQTSTGSPASLARMNSLVGLGRVMTYPNRNGAASRSMPERTWVGRARRGTKGSSLMADLEASTVSLAKIWGTLLGSSHM